MCLYPKEEVKTAPRRYVAYKVVGKGRKPSVHHQSPVVYRKGATVKVDRKNVVRYFRSWGSYGPGLHVYTTRARAKTKVLGSEKIIKVQVSPKDWVADGIYGDALYTKIKVLT